MGDVMIGAAPVGQPGTVSGNQPAAGGEQAGQAPEQGQPQVNYVTSEQLNATMEEIKRMIQSSTDKSYSRVEKMIGQLKQAGIQNPTEAQARAMLELQGQNSGQGTWGQSHEGTVPGGTVLGQGQSEQQGQKPDAQKAESAAASPEAEAWIKQNGGDITQAFWNDIYDAAQESGVGMITREDPEYSQYFLDNGQPKSFPKPRQFVRAFEQAFEAKKARLERQGIMSGNLAGSPGLSSGGGKSTFHDPKTTDRSDLITMGLREQRRRRQ